MLLVMVKWMMLFLRTAPEPRVLTPATAISAPVGTAMARDMHPPPFRSVRCRDRMWFLRELSKAPLLTSRLSDLIWIRRGLLATRLEHRYRTRPIVASKDKLEFEPLHILPHKVPAPLRRSFEMADRLPSSPLRVVTCLPKDLARAALQIAALIPLVPLRTAQPVVSVVTALYRVTIVRT